VSIRPCVNKRQIDVPISAIRIKDIKETVLIYSCVRCFLQGNAGHTVQNKALNIGGNIEYFMRIKLIRKQEESNYLLLLISILMLEIQDVIILINLSAKT
jgi:hypothetical protein